MILGLWWTDFDFLYGVRFAESHSDTWHSSCNGVICDSIKVESDVRCVPPSKTPVVITHRAAVNRSVWHVQQSDDNIIISARKRTKNAHERNQPLAR